ncbi:winged helix-turn-helix domain-containing protein [Streptomyces chartreusis]|uniref:winged helix-turn-helix domain-containing protein n=1 Tax=Streptomyces chartreusis TaxID=1969 RepID=UPI0021017717|nr:winged helix-turn-helix domain-containing protein [Streptomyces chartreusis]
MAGIWDYDHFGDGRSTDVHIARLRRKLGKAHRHRIVTVRRVGCKYVSDQQEDSAQQAPTRPDADGASAGALTAPAAADTRTIGFRRRVR